MMAPAVVPSPVPAMVPSEKSRAAVERERRTHHPPVSIAIIRIRVVITAIIRWSVIGRGITVIAIVRSVSIRAGGETADHCAGD